MDEDLFWKILTAVEARFAGLVQIPTSVRKKPVMNEGDSCPQLIVFPASLPMGIVKETFKGVVCREWKVGVALIQPGNSQISTDELKAFLALQSRVFSIGYQFANSQPLPGVATAFDLSVDFNAPIDLVSQTSGTYDVSGFVLKYQVEETRVS